MGKTLRGSQRNSKNTKALKEQRQKRKGKRNNNVSVDRRSDKEREF